MPLGFILDPLSRTMLLVVTGVGSLIHIYSFGYMRSDEGKSRYFAAPLALHVRHARNRPG